MVFVVGGLTTNILPTNEATLPAAQAATTKILPTKCLNIAEPRIFCPPKITRYTVIGLPIYTVICDVYKYFGLEKVSKDIIIIIV